MIIKFNKNNNNSIASKTIQTRSNVVFGTRRCTSAQCVLCTHTIWAGAQFGRRFEVYNILLCTTAQWYNMLYYACVSRQSETQCTNVDRAAIMWLEIVRNGFGLFNGRCIGTNHERRFFKINRNRNHFVGRPMFQTIRSADILCARFSWQVKFIFVRLFDNIVQKH